MANNEILEKVINFLSSDWLWLYFTLVILSFYLVIALFTWSFRRSLKFLGIPSITTGLLLMSSYFIINIIPLSDTLIKVIISSSKPVLNVGIICLIMGIVMLVINKILGIIFDKKEDRKIEIDQQPNEEIKEKIAN